MRRRILKEIMLLRRDATRNWREILKVENEIVLFRKKNMDEAISKMQSSAREMLIMSREL